MFGFDIGITIFWIYIISAPSPIVVFSDYNTLDLTDNMKNDNQRLKWSLFLQEYNIDIREIQGKHNLIVEAHSLYIEILFHVHFQ